MSLLIPWRILNFDNSQFMSSRHVLKILYLPTLGRGHRSVTSLNGSGGGRTKSSKSRRERGEDRGTPYDTGSSTNLNSRGSRRHHRNHHGSSGSSSSNMGGNVSSKFGEQAAFFTRPVFSFPSKTCILCVYKVNIFSNK